MLQPKSLFDMSPMLKEIIITQVLEKDIETFDLNEPLSEKDSEKVIGFFQAMEYMRKKSSRKEKRKKVNGQFSKNVKQLIRKK